MRNASWTIACGPKEEGSIYLTTSCLPGAKNEDVAEKPGQVMGGGMGGVLVHVGTNSEDVAEKPRQVMGGGMGGVVLVHVGTKNADKKGTTAIVGKRLVKTLKEA